MYKNKVIKVKILLDMIVCMVISSNREIKAFKQFLNFIRKFFFSLVFIMKYLNL